MPKHPEDGPAGPATGNPIAPPRLWCGDEPIAYRVRGSDGWNMPLDLMLQQDWDDAAGDTVSGSDRHHGVIRRQSFGGRTVATLPEGFVAAPAAPEPGPQMTLEDMMDAAGLTEKQRAVTEMIAAGCSEREIADVLGCGRPNVQQHRDLAFRKLIRVANTIQP
jgi:DNA-binding CsgD family transcriptional regulator